ncbi:MAG: thioredoxin family protein [Thermoproteota archaeon]
MVTILPAQKCMNFLKLAARLAKKMKVEVEHIDASSSEAKRRVLVVPSMFVDDKLVAAGDIIDEEEIEELIEKLISEDSSDAR